MDVLLNKISQAGMDILNIREEHRLDFWNHVIEHIAQSPEEKAKAFIGKSEFLLKINNLEESISGLYEALSLLSDDIDTILMTKFHLIHRLIENGQYEKALEECSLYAELSGEYGYITHYVLSVITLGMLCEAYGDYPLAILIHKRISKIEHLLTSSLILTIYKLRLLCCNIALKQYTTAEYLLTECEALCTLNHNSELNSQLLFYKSRLYRAKKNFHGALNVFGLLNTATKRKNNSTVSHHLHLDRVNYLVELGQTVLANFYLKNLKKRVKNIHSPALLKEFYETFSHVHELNNNHEQALFYQEKALAIEIDLIKTAPIYYLSVEVMKKLSQIESKLTLSISEKRYRELQESSVRQKQMLTQLQKDVYIDPLTQLQNRRWLDGKLEQLLEQERSFAFLIVDIDHFKSINDELSHLVGDKAISNVANEISSYFIPYGASCVRYGGEEFLVIMEDISLMQLKVHAESFRKRIANFPWMDILGDRSLTVSIGITLHRRGETTQRTFHRADKALYRAKANGRNQVCSESI
ncbi:GGDEF domain-containing protein [Vibrio cincinnatiensis]|jgi:diguanylate cyclase (GGDEF)-like protein|uniref:GGDEF domain-containing protein n=2 Tax=Vibrio cincinnatiensis TaxID=675 RepID=UPI001302ADA0|nr:GGDEF domain-containing protein [Vibrio cincinnatiensis]